MRDRGYTLISAPLSIKKLSLVYASVTKRRPLVVFGPSLAATNDGSVRFPTQYERKYKEIGTFLRCLQSARGTNKIHPVNETLLPSDGMGYWNDYVICIFRETQV